MTGVPVGLLNLVCAEIAVMQTAAMYMTTRDDASLKEYPRSMDVLRSPLIHQAAMPTATPWKRAEWKKKEKTERELL